MQRDRAAERLPAHSHSRYGNGTMTKENKLKARATVPRYKTMDDADAERFVEKLQELCDEHGVWIPNRFRLVTEDAADDTRTFKYEYLDFGWVGVSKQESTVATDEHKAAQERKNENYAFWLDQQSWKADNPKD